MTTLSDEIFTFEVSEDMELESFRALCEIETGISAREIVVFWNGRPLHDDRRKFSCDNEKNYTYISLFTRSLNLKRDRRSHDKLC